MNGDQIAGSTYAIGAIVLVGSGLLARRLPLSHTLKLATGWIVIFGIALLVALYFT